MILYAPAWLRRWRRPLVPALLAMGVLAFVALAALPPFEQALAEHFAAILAGAIAWPLLMFLLNGEPLASRVPFETARIDPAGAIPFDVRSTEAWAMAAQAEFWLRSVRELRFGSVAIPPVATAFLLAACLKVAPGTGAVYFFAAFTILSVVVPGVLFVLGRKAAAAQAQRFPERHVRVGREGIAVGAADSAGLAWSNVVRVWESPATLTLVLNPYLAVQLPRAQVPEAARERMLGAARAGEAGR